MATTQTPEIGIAPDWAGSPLSTLHHGDGGAVATVAAEETEGVTVVRLTVPGVTLTIRTTATAASLPGAVPVDITIERS